MKTSQQGIHALTQGRLMSLLHYNPVTGFFTWVSKSSTQSRVIIGSQAGCVNKESGYVEIMVDGVSHLAHRLAWLYQTGFWPDVEIDHKNRRRSDNSWLNLREATSSQNQHNRGMNSNNTSGHKGISWCKKAQKWKACFSTTIDGVKKYKYVGLFLDKEEAVSKYREAVDKAHGEFKCF